MGRYVFSLKWLPMAAAGVLMASAVAARPPATNGWQQIIFSSPDNKQISSNLTIATNRLSSSEFENRLRLFQDSSPVTFLVAPPPAPVPDRARHFDKSSEDNRPWEFMTPAEILGIAPDQTRQKSDAQGAQSSLTPMERYLQGQSSFSRFRTNSADNPFRGQNPWAGGNDQTNGTVPVYFGGGWDNLQSNISRPYLGSTPDNGFSGDPSQGSSWSKNFGSPGPQATFNSGGSQSEMNQFMQLLNSGSTAREAATAPDEMSSFKPQAAWPNAESTAPLANPLGTSFTPLSSGIGKPTGLAPLPSIAPAPAVPAAAPPAWAPQPAPWLSPTPQPFAVPQRKF